MMLNLRRASYDDVLVTLDRLASDQVVPGCPFDARAMADAHTSLAVEVDGQLAGVFGADRAAHDEYEFFGITDPTRLRGAGLELIDRLKEIARTLPEIRRAYMWTRDVRRYRKFARAMGFSEVGRDGDLILHVRVF
ncbi:MAG TPA: hypothetical protein PKL84_05175 [Candidatus Hydrogenedentes bacterium]|nr:hypothetical protein [Candidatus Hydrogenedentota bacterium]